MFVWWEGGVWMMDVGDWVYWWGFFFFVLKYFVRVCLWDSLGLGREKGGMCVLVSFMREFVIIFDSMVVFVG